MIVEEQLLNGRGHKISPWNFKVSTIIPVWENYEISKILSRFTKPFVDEIIIIIDEVSPNMRKAIKHGIKEAIPPVTVIENKERKGIGHAIRQGLKHSLRKSYDVVVVMAGNGKDDPKEIPRLLNVIKEGYDYVQGSRFISGGKSEKIPILRGIFVKLWPYIWRLFIGIRCTEVANGFRAYRTKIFKEHSFNINQKWLDHYALEYYLHYKFLTLGYTYKEAPVTKTYLFRNKGGYSKIRPYKDWIHIVMPLIFLKLGIRS